MSIKYRCPSDTTHKDFLGTAKVAQEWLCNDKGEYVSTVNECVDVLNSPEELKLVCHTCGVDAEEYEYVPDVVDLLREQDWSGWSIGEQGTLVLHGKSGDMVAQIVEETKDSGNRIFKASIHPYTLRVKSTRDKSLADCIAWCEDNLSDEIGR